MEGIELIATERERQIDVLGWTPEHDLIEHRHQELVYAAAAYLLNGSGVRVLPSMERFPWENPMEIWPWDKKAWKPSPENRIRELVKAGALIVAEIDRLAALTPAKTGEQPEQGANR